jgi:hypothetical protein
MPRFYRSDDPHTLLAPTRMDVFATRERTIGKGKRAKTVAQGVGYQAWNDCPKMESAMARLQGAGSFYWPNAWRAYQAAKRILASDASVHQIKIETISGREIGRLYR